MQNTILPSYRHKTTDLTPTLTKTASLKSIDESLVDFAESFVENYVKGRDPKERKQAAQFFTPKQVALFMAGMFEINKQEIRLLDPGAGLGMLSAAFCSRILNSPKPVNVTIDAYENDPHIIPYLTKVLHKCKTELEKKGHALAYNIFEKDFILDNSNYLGNETLFETKGSLKQYDHIISNPPYYKLNGDSLPVKLLNNLVSGQPNIYSCFMAMSLKMLQPTGQMIFITPRSFCSGLYFKTFRKWLLEQGEIKQIHLFESRKEVFSKNEVLQENVIVKISPHSGATEKQEVLITASQDKAFHDLRKMSIIYEDLLHKSNGDIFIKIPLKETDVKIQHIVNFWPNTLNKLGLKVSTGPIVSYRAKQYLSSDFEDKFTTAPLLWMHNIRGMNVVWPLEKKKREAWIKAGEETKHLLLPVKNFVLIKRFSSKEQKRRLYAGVLLKSDFDFDSIGLENHLNYIYKYKGVLTEEESYGICGLLNTSIMDGFFRMMNGNTQVNATDLDNLPLPSMAEIRKIGEEVIRQKPLIGLELDLLVAEHLGIDKQLIHALDRGNNKHDYEKQN